MIDNSIVDEPSDSSATGERLAFVTTVSELVGKVAEIIKLDREIDRREAKERGEDFVECSYYFRGETRNYNEDSTESIPTEFDSYIDRKDKDWLCYEGEFYHDAYSLNPESFVSDKTMVERLTRMQHYRLPTRFADLSSNVLLAAYFACEDAPGKPEGLLKDGSLRIFKVHPKKMKPFRSDIITAIAHLPFVSEDIFDIGDAPNHEDTYSGLTTLCREIRKECPSFSLNEGFAKRLRRDIQQVWAFKPIWNNDRIRYQEGIFLAFGCGNHKASLEATFSAEDFRKSDLIDPKFVGQPAPTSGLMEVGRVRIKERAKEPILEELRVCGVMKELVYPDLADSCKALAEAKEERKTQDKTLRELQRVVKAIYELTGQRVEIRTSEKTGYSLAIIDPDETRENGADVSTKGIEKEEDSTVIKTDAEVYLAFWTGFRDYIKTNLNHGEENLYDATKDDVASDRRNWFNTHMVGKISQGWFDLNFTYTKDRTISIYIATQNLATRDALSLHKDQINALMKEVMGVDMQPEWERQNFPNRPNGLKRIVFSLDCSGKTSEQIYPEMVSWLSVLAKYLSEKVAKLDFKKKIFNSSVFEI